MKKFILNADDFGMSEAYNRAVLEGYESGILKSTSLTANGEAFEEACEKIIPACPDLGVGIHLNIIEGKALFNIIVNNGGCCQPVEVIHHKHRLPGILAVLCRKLL